MPVSTEVTEELSSENFVPDAEKDETDVKGENSFRKIKICLSKIKSFLEEEDDEEDSDTLEEDTYEKSSFGKADAGYTEADLYKGLEEGEDDEFDDDYKY